MIYKVARFFVKLYFLLFYRVQIEGIKNIPSTGPVLLYANHPSAADMFLVACFMKRKVHYMAKVELFKNPILAYILKLLGAFPVSRGKGDVGSVKTVFRLLNQGEVVGIFPEGTRTKKKDPKKRKSGAAMLAIQSNAPILPVGIKWNSKLFSKIEVVYGKPFRIGKKDDNQRPAKEELIGATQYIMDRIYGLIGQ